MIDVVLLRTLIVQRHKSVRRFSEVCQISDRQLCKILAGQVLPSLASQQLIIHHLCLSQHEFHQIFLPHIPMRMGPDLSKNNV